jgi:6-phosphogluconolactonase
MSRITTSRRMVTAKNYEDLCALAVTKILEISRQAIKERGRCRIALSGGATPRGVYMLMASPAYRDQFDWKNIQFFLSDERWVPLDSPRSNYHMMATSGIPVECLHPFKMDATDAREGALVYEQQMLDEFALTVCQWPRFDLILLGLGEDGHTASLFPNNEALKEQNHLTAVANAAGVPEKRVTMTLPVINHAAVVLFLVSGQNKAAILKKVFEDPDGKSLPAGKVRLIRGEEWWLTDQTAVSLLGNF